MNGFQEKALRTYARTDASPEVSIKIKDRKSASPLNIPRDSNFAVSVENGTEDRDATEFIRQDLPGGRRAKKLFHSGL